MSLQVEEGRRGRSRSPGRRERSRSPAVPAMVEAREPSYAYPEDDLDDRYTSSRRGDDRERGAPRVVSAREPGGGGAVPYPEDDDRDDMFPGGRSLYDFEERRGPQRAPSPPDDGYHRASRDKVDDPRSSREKHDDYRGSREKPDDYRSSREKPDDYRSSREKPDDYRSSREKPDDYRSSREKVEEDPRVRYADPSRREKEPRREKKPSRDDDDDDEEEDKFKYLPQKYSRSSKADDDDAKGKPARDSDRDKGRKERPEEDRYGKRSSPPKSPRDDDSPTGYAYAKPKQWEYAKMDEKSKYEYAKPDEKPAYGTRYEKPDDKPIYGTRFEKPDDKPTYGTRFEKRDDSPDRKYAARAPSPGPDYSRGKKYPADDPRGSAANVLTVGPSDDRRGKRDKSPAPPTQRMSSLSVNTGHHSLNMSLAAAPGSPLLESYHGTYQDMSPMPSPLLMASNGPGAYPNVVDGLSPMNSDDERDGKKRNRRARFHDPEDSASRLAKALKSDRKAPDTEPLIEILPGLTHEQVMELRKEYKALVKTGADRKGVNIAKHIRARLKDEDPSLMKACYAVALGRWESESYWANFWYQGDKTRRELLIESLMGRTNEEIRLIKDGFSDKKYDNSLTKAIKTELKEDKFKKAILLVLDERRMEDYDPYGRRIPLDMRLVDQDAEELRRALKAEKGGESLMINIVVSRSDSHLREVLKLYEHNYRSNFARDALKKSGNLVGELLAHILNGVINKPVRDALLVHHALSKKDELKRELIISRLVRYHWDRHHMEAVKRAFRERYKKDMQEAVKEGTSGDWGLFCRELCIYRMPDDVKRVERVQIPR